MASRNYSTGILKRSVAEIVCHGLGVRYLRSELLETLTQVLSQYLERLCCKIKFNIEIENRVEPNLEDVLKCINMPEILDYCLNIDWLKGICVPAFPVKMKKDVIKVHQIKNGRVCLGLKKYYPSVLEKKSNSLIKQIKLQLKLCNRIDNQDLNLFCNTIPGIENLKDLSLPELKNIYKYITELDKKFLDESSRSDEGENINKTIAEQYCKTNSESLKTYEIVSTCPTKIFLSKKQNFIDNNQLKSPPSKRLRLI